MGLKLVTCVPLCFQVFTQIHHKAANFDIKIQSVSMLLKKKIYLVIYTRYNDVIIIPTFNLYFEWKMSEKKKENYENLNILRPKRAFR